MVFSVMVHLLILTAFFLTPTNLPTLVEQKPITVELIDGRRLAAPPALTAAAPALAVAPPVTPPRPAAPKPHPQRAIARPAPPHPDIDSLLADAAPVSGTNPELSDAQLAGAAMAGSGEGGRTCDMASRLQDALRRDPLVQTAVSRFTGKAIKVWDGDWIWFQGDVGQGLTAVRQAMAWEIAFAPEACRNKPMHGLVVLSLNQSRGSVRLAVGQGDWRWTDLLTSRDAGPLKR